MKKSLIALAVAGAMTAPMIAQADATLYGSLRVGLQSTDEADLDLRDESSRIGIKGTVDLGLENTKGLFHWEANINTADSDQYGEMFAARLSYIGMTGDWGTALVGKQYHPHYLWINLATNVLNTASGDAGEWAFLGNDFHKRTDNTLAYLSPVMNGFQFAAGAVLAASDYDADGVDVDEDGELDDDIDGYNIAAKWSANDLTLAASIGEVTADNTAANDNETWGVSAKYKMDNVTLSARYEDKEYQNGNEADAFGIAAVVAVGEGTNLKVRYSEKEVNGDKGDQWAFEAEQIMGKGRVYAAYYAFDDGAEDMLAGSKKIYADRLVLGYRVDF